MRRLDVPFNLNLLQLSEENLRHMRPVTSLDTFEGATKNFHPDGLYSTQTFGVVGSDARFARYGYVDLRISVLHPTVYRALMKLKGFYEGILSGKEFAVWDAEAKDFVRSTALEGETGFAFFLQHWKDIEFEARPSVRREHNIALINKYKAVAELRHWVVMPAGYRDLEIDDTGRECSDEVNSLYYKLVAISNTIHPGTVKISPEAYNTQRWSLQRGVNEVYDLIERLVQGKKNLVMGKWASRKVFNGTRNVITSQNVVSEELGDKNHPGFHSTLVGLYQCLKALLPISQYRLHTGFLASVFTSATAPARLTHAKTLRSERVQLPSEVFDAWMTREGIEKFITRFADTTIRHEPVMIGEYYLGLIYRGPDKTFKLIHGIDDLPEGRLAEHCRPLSLAELFYCALYEVANSYPGYVTRYPIAGLGSIYPSWCYLKSTIQSERRVPLDDQWQAQPDLEALEFPVVGSEFYNSLSPHSTRLAGLKADFDGDTSSWTMAYSDEAVAEIRAFFNSPACYVAPDGRFLANLDTDTVKYTLFSMTGA